MNSNTVEFVLRMRDLMSGGLSKLSAASQTAFGKMARHADDMTKRNKVLGMSYDQLQQRIREVENTVRTSTIPSQIANSRRELAALQRQSNNHAGNLSGGSKSGGMGIGGMALGTLAGGFALQAGGAILGVLKDGVGAAISGSMEKQQAITGLSTFLGKDGANDAYKNIQKDADVSPFDTASLLSVNRALISAGLNAKVAREDSMNLANAISAVGGGNAELQRMAANMQQIKTVGKATEMDIKQFGMAGINIYEMLSKSTGKSIEQVKQMDVTYDQLAKAMAMARGKGGIYEGALEAQGNTMAGKMSTIKDKFGNALTQIGDAFSPIISKVLDVGIRFAESIGPMLEKVQPYIDMISGGLGMAIDYVLNLTSGSGEWSAWLEVAQNILGGIIGFVSKVLGVVFEIVGKVAQWIGKSEILKDVFRLISWLIDRAKESVEGLGIMLNWVWDKVLKPILDGIESAYKWVKELVTGEKTEIDINASKTVTTVPPKTPTAPSYAADLTRFSNSGAPAAASSGSAIAKGEKTRRANNTSSKSTGDTISGGGQKIININLQKFFDNIQFTTLNGGESSDQLQKIVMECLGRVLYDGAKVM